MISSVVLTKNEEKNIDKCLKTLRWCDEIIVIDDNSTDETVEIAKKYNAHIYLHNLNSDFAAQRNYGLSKAKGEWVLFVDADERISNSLAYEISAVIKSEDCNCYRGFYVKRFDCIWGKQLRYGENSISLLRLAKRGFGHWGGLVHEQWKINGKVGKLKNPILHYPHQLLEQFLIDINFYTDIRANELRNKKVSVNILSIALYPFSKFFIDYFIKKGFMDGIAGLVFAITMSLHSFLVRAKLWLENTKKQ